MRDSGLGASSARVAGKARTRTAKVTSSDRRVDTGRLRGGGGEEAENYCAAPPPASSATVFPRAGRRGYNERAFRTVVSLGGAAVVSQRRVQVSRGRLEPVEGQWRVAMTHAHPHHHRVTQHLADDP